MILYDVLIYNLQAIIHLKEEEEQNIVEIEDLKNEIISFCMFLTHLKNQLKLESKQVYYISLLNFILFLIKCIELFLELFNRRL